MRKYLLAAFLLCQMPIFSQINIKTTSKSPADFSLFSNGKAASVYVDQNDFTVVKKVSSLFSEDMKRITGKECNIVKKVSNNKQIVIIGTIGHNELIDKLIRDGKLKTSAIKNGWEQYVIQTIEKPMKGIEKALVIAGCDRRGTAYGTFALSEAMGVSPLYWWADVPSEKKQQIYVEPIQYASKTPSIKYRGIFINDEGWGITPWAAKTFDPELGDIGPKTYAKVCELILRMKGNMLAPAMHPGSGAFNKYPKNKEVADEYGIIMTSSHCEPLLFNNVTEWFTDTMGEWNYMTNKDGINKVLDQRISENYKYENVYTLAMRGIHDSGLIGIPKDKEVAIVEEVLNDQRNILSKYISQPIDSIPQLFVPYKEVMDIYEKGLKVPEDVTLVWPDDNYGYMKRLSNNLEQQRKGGSGIYYHISYCGQPHDYLWLNTTPSTLIYEEMRKAYDTGANRYWLLNVGDIKPGELGMKFFLDMAWDIESTDMDKAYDFNALYLSSVFGKRYENDLKDIMNTYFLLGFQHKPEAMGWGYLWNNYHDKERVNNSDFSFVNYQEAEKRIAEYSRIANKAESIYRSLPAAQKPAFYELVLYPVKGAELINKKLLTAQKNRWYAVQRRSITNQIALETKAYQDSLDYYTDKYNSMLNGKWNHMMMVSPGWVGTYQEMPPTEKYTPSEGAELGIFIPEQEYTEGRSSLKVLPSINPYIEKDLFIELYNKGNKPFNWKAVASQDWIQLARTKGTITHQERIKVSVDWNKVPKGENIMGEISISTLNNNEKIYLPVFNPTYPTKNDLKGMYVENNGYVSINAGLFHRTKENKDIKIRTVKGLGYENECVQLGEATKPSQDAWITNETPKAEYDFYSFNSGTVNVHVYALPLFPIDSKHDTRFGVMVDDGMIQWMSTSAKEYSGDWKRNVFRNSAITTITMDIPKPGKHVFKLLCSNPGVIIQKIVIDFGGMKKSYLGPEITLVK